MNLKPRFPLRSLLLPRFVPFAVAVVVTVFTPIANGDDTTTAAYLKRYCFDCHRGETSEGKVDLASFAESQSLRLLFDVYDQTVLEYMPPADAEQPTAAERAAFVAELASMLKRHGHDRKTQPGYGNYVDHEALFTPNDLKPASPKRVWRIDPSAMAELGNKLAGRVVYRARGQSVGKEHPSFTYRAPAHTFRDYDATSYFENTTTELALAYVKQIADYMEEFRFQPQMKIAAARGAAAEVDRIGETYRLIFEREIPDAERQALAKLDPRWAVAALILKSDAVFRMETEMDDYELARTLGFSLNESGPDPELFKAVATRPLADVLDERMQTEEFHWRLVRFLREYFEYDNAANVFKDPEDQPPEVFERGQQYHPIWHVDDADHFCLRIVREDQAVLRQLLTSNRYSVRGGLNSLHIKILQRGFENGYRAGYHGVYGIAESDLPPWRADHEVPHRKGMLHHPAWLIAFSDNEKNQAIQRGRWITTKLLGGHVPDAPVEVDASLPDDPTLTLRRKMEVTRAAKCWACHRNMDDLGLPFEQFDFLGHYRDAELGSPVEVTGFALGAEVKDPYAYVETLAESRRVQQVFLRHAFRFFMGRNETVNDANTLIAMDDAFQPQGSLKAALKVLFLSDSYRRRQ